MKKYFACLLLLAPGLALAQAPAPAKYPYAIKGKIGQLSAPAKVYLTNGMQVLDSATVQRGRFELKGTTEFPHSAALVLERQGQLQSGLREGKMPNGKMGRYFFESPDRIRLFLEPGPVMVTSADSMRMARIKGGTLTADYQQIQDSHKPAEDRMRKAGRNGDLMAFLKELAQTDARFITAHPTSWVSLEALRQFPIGTPYTEVAPLYAALSPTLRNSVAGREYGRQLDEQKATALGSQAPAFTQQTPDGKQVSLADYRGKYVLVDFWASWCSPCRAENPVVLKAYEAFKGRNFEVLGVSLDEEKTRAAWVKAIADDHMPWTQVSDLRGFDSAVAQQYGVKGIPQNFLVDPSGKIIASNLHGPELEATLAKFIK